MNRKKKHPALSRAFPSLLAVGLFAGGAASAHAAVCHVTTAGSGAGDGVSWATSMDLQTALGNPGCTEIRVASGVYTPGAAGMQSATFAIQPGVAVYGGFAGTESDRIQRNPVLNLTVLSGDIDGNDSGAGGVNASHLEIEGSNSFHVVTMDGSLALIGPATVLDGFTITGGDGGDSVSGGGLLCFASGVDAGCSPRLGNLVFSGNRAQSGAAMHLSGTNGASSAPALGNVLFTGNFARHGGALYNDGTGGNASPTLDEVGFCRQHLVLQRRGDVQQRQRRRQFQPADAQREQPEQYDAPRQRRRDVQLRLRRGQRQRAGARRSHLRRKPLG